MRKTIATPRKLSRLIRFVDLGVLPVGVAAQYDTDKNLVRIDKGIYDTLNLFEQSQLLFTKGDVLYSPQ